MKKLFTVLEELWVAVAFAEAGEFEMVRCRNQQPLRSREAVRVQAV